MARRIGQIKRGQPGREPSARRYANPWAFRDAVPPGELVADFSGQLIEVSEYRRGGIRVRVPAPVDPLGERLSPPRERCMLAQLLRRMSATMARYRNHGWCTPTELRTIEALWLGDVGLREFARREGVKPAAISARIEGLARKAPEFYRWWLLKHRRRRAARRDSG